MSLLQAYADADHALHDSYSRVRRILADLDAIVSSPSPLDNPAPVSPGRPGPIMYGHVSGQPDDRRLMPSATGPTPTLARDVTGGRARGTS